MFAHLIERADGAVVSCLAPEVLQPRWMAALASHAQWPAGLALIDGRQRVSLASEEARATDLIHPDAVAPGWMTVLWDAPAHLLAQTGLDAAALAQWPRQTAAWRAALDAAGCTYIVLPVESLPAAVDMAAAAVAHAWQRAQQPPEPGRWRWVCADCDDAECERHQRQAWRQPAP